MQAHTSAGSVRINAAFDDCPSLLVNASPSAARVGGQVAVAVHPSDDDPADRLTYRWAARAGSFANAMASDTFYTCPGPESAGPQTITVSASDGTCTAAQSVSISCFAVSDAAGTGSFGDSGAGGNDGGRLADGGADASGGRDQMGGAGGGAGGSNVGGAAGACTGDPTTCEGEACNTCTFKNCVISANTASSGTRPTDGCDFYTSDAQRTRCKNLYACISASRCAEAGDGDPHRCWCGGANIDQCALGTVPAGGPCVQQIIDAAGSTDPPIINLRFVDPDFPLGGAMNLAACRATYCPNPVCHI